MSLNLLKCVVIVISVWLVNGEVKLGDYDLLLEVSSHESVELVNGVTSTRLNVSYDRVVPNIEENSLVYSINNTVYMLNLTNNSTSAIVTGANVSELKSSDKRVYWVENSTVVKSFDFDLNTTQDLVAQTSDCVIHSIAVHSGTVYYTHTCGNTRTNSSIMSYDGNRTSVLATYTQLPRSLNYANSRVYWINNPPGIYFTINSVSVLTGHVNTLVKLAEQHATSLAVGPSGDIFWTDVNKRLYTLKRSSSVQIHKRFPTTGVHALANHSNVVESSESLAPTAKSAATKSEQTAVPRSTTTKSEASAAAKASTQSSVESRNTEIPESPTTTLVPVTRSSKVESQKSVLVQQESRGLESSAIRICRADEALSCSHVCIVLNTKITCLQEERVIKEDWSPGVIAVISVLSTLLTLTTLCCVYMTLRVRNLSKKPIIRRRVVVNRRTSESSSSPTSVCEMIDIENCCNMNVCETPCYERTLLQPGGSVISVNTTNGPGWKSGTKDDKKCLLSI